jgi:MurNAc alpha-1-phosphate uridylyltransferase
MSKVAQIDTAMVLSAGLGTRMRPITDKIPKPLVKVHGKTLLDHALDNLEMGGIERCFVNVHYLADQIEAHLSTRSHPHIIISDERAELLDSGGGVKKAVADEADGPLLILNGDSFWTDDSESNICRLQAAWDPNRMDMLLLLANVEQSTGFEGAGDFFSNQQGQLTRRGLAPSAPCIYAGAIVTTVEFLRTVPEAKFSLNQLFDAAIGENRLYGMALDVLWLHVGTPASITEAEQAIDRHAAQNRPNQPT